MIRWLLILAFFCCVFEGISQNIRADSVRITEMRSQLKDAKQIFSKNIDSAFLALNRVESDFKVSGSQDLWAEFLIMKAYFFLASEEHDSIINLLTPVVKDFDQISLSNKASAFQHIGHAYKVAWVPDSALVNYIRALKLYQKADNQRGLSVSYLALGLTYNKLKKKEMAAYFFDKSLEYSKNSKIIEIHKKNIAKAEKVPDSTDKTLELALDILKIAEEQDNDRLLMVAYADLKKNYFAVKNYDKALEFAMKELEFIEATSANAFLSNNHSFVADIYKLQNKKERAIQKYQEALPNATDSLRLNIYKNLKELYLEEGNLKAALGALENYSDLKDSISTRNAEASIAKVMAEFKTELQEEQIKTLSYENELSTVKINRQRTTLFGTIGASLLLFILGISGYRNYKTRQELDRTQLNFKLLQSQMNPHFMFNALNEIKLNLKNSDEGKTKQNLTAYSKMMRQVLETSNKEFIPIKTDIEFIENYLEMQQLVNQNSFSYSVSVDPELDINYLVLPPMLTQPFVENAIIHGVRAKDNGEIDIAYHGAGDDVIVTISDNGVGMHARGDSHGDHGHESIATTNIRQRLETYEKLHKFKIELNIESEKDLGTKIKLTFPVRVKQGL